MKVVNHKNYNFKAHNKILTIINRINIIYYEETARMVRACVNSKWSANY